jgi:hypothetical protein
MDSKTIVTVTRMIIGGAIFITSMVTGVDGPTQMFAMFLMGAPVEILQPKKKEE